MNPSHLLEQAEQLARGGTGRPRQSDLRRAISTAYYALFHLLIQAGASVVSRQPILRPFVARQYDHKDMKSASRSFAEGKPPAQLQQAFTSIPADLTTVAETFIELQEARHRADYDLRGEMHFTRQDVLDFTRRTRQAFQAWESVRTTAVGELYLLSMLFHPLVRPT